MAAIHGRFTRSQILIQNGQWGLPGLIPVFSWRFHNLLAAQGGGVKAVPVLTQTRCVAVASRPPPRARGNPSRAAKLQLRAAGIPAGPELSIFWILDSAFPDPQPQGRYSCPVPRGSAEPSGRENKTPLAGDGASTPWARTMRQLPERFPVLLRRTGWTGRCPWGGNSGIWGLECWQRPGLFPCRQ